MTKTLRDLVKAPPLTEKELMELTINYLKNESRILRLYPGIIDIVTTKIELPNEIVKTLSILIDKKLESTYNLIDAHHKLTAKYYKIYLRFNVESHIKEYILDEYRMILQIKRYVTSEELIEGKHLRYLVSSSELELIDQPMERMVERYLDSLKPIIMAYEENTNEWFKKYWETFQESNKKENENYVESQLNKINPYLKKALIYSKECKSNNKRPTVSGFARKLKEARSTLVDKLGPELHKKVQIMFAQSNSIKD